MPDELSAEDHAPEDTATPAVRRGQRGPRPSAELAERRRKEIFGASARLFFRMGVANTSIDEVAESLGYTKGIVYHYFASKADILYAMFLDVQRDACTAIETIRAESTCASEALRGILKYISLRIRDDEWRYAFVCAQDVMQHLPRAYAKEVALKGRENQALVADVVRWGIESGEFIDVHPVILTRIAMGATMDTARWFDSDGAVSQEELEEILLRVIMTGITVPRRD